MVTDKEVKEVIGIGTFLLILNKLKPKVAAGAPVGGIVASQPVVYGLCGKGQCMVGETAYVYVAFTNMGNVHIDRNVGIKINDNIVKQQSVGLDPGKEITLEYELDVEQMTYNICGVVL